VVAFPQVSPPKSWWMMMMMMTTRKMIMMMMIIMIMGGTKHWLEDHDLLGSNGKIGDLGISL
jgi:hypothetical protein